MTYKTIKECAIYYICNYGDKLSNKQIAEKVKVDMDSKTTSSCIAWYKNKIKKGIIQVDKNKCKWLKKTEVIINQDFFIEALENEIIENEAELYVSNLEKVRTGKYPKKMKANNGPGYDFDSGDRHIEVKGSKRKNKTWLQLTANETDALIKDSKYYLYLVEGDFDEDIVNIDVYIIPKDELLEMAQMKIHARLTKLKNKEKRSNWIYKGKLNEKKNS